VVAGAAGAGGAGRLPDDAVNAGELELDVEQDDSVDADI